MKLSSARFIIPIKNKDDTKNGGAARNGSGKTRENVGITIGATGFIINCNRRGQNFCSIPHHLFCALVLNEPQGV